MLALGAFDRVGQVLARIAGITDGVFVTVVPDTDQSVAVIREAFEHHEVLGLPPGARPGATWSRPRTARRRSHRRSAPCDASEGGAMTPAELLETDLRELILRGLGEHYMSVTCTDGERIQTGNHYQSVSLGDVRTRGFRDDRSTGARPDRLHRQEGAGPRVQPR